MSGNTLVMRMVLATALLVGCEVRPPHFDEPGDVDKYIVGKKWSAACAGLGMREDIAMHTATRLSDHAHLGAVKTCLCDALYDSETHTVNVVVAQGLEGVGNAFLAECLLPALSDAGLGETTRCLLSMATTPQAKEVKPFWREHDPASEATIPRCRLGKPCLSVLLPLELMAKRRHRVQTTVPPAASCRA